ncbi:hypothetical protein PoB_001647100 [Plakobranchus ocellatus]|uniref:Uncharacterized protein n=1 Tax=Plakobranchus ocellatus TaxID=259542 RepID=A0AAV3Z5U8_9GAST|nr:hypothetical protein PoB_001647100 [Plakobranchus ocellatus]
MISGFQALRQAMVLVAGLAPETERVLADPLCHNTLCCLNSKCHLAKQDTCSVQEAVKSRNKIPVPDKIAKPYRNSMNRQ